MMRMICSVDFCEMYRSCYFHDNKKVDHKKVFYSNYLSLPHNFNREILRRK